MRVLPCTSALAFSSADVPQLAVKRGVLRAELLDRALDLLLEVGLASVEMIEAAGDLAGYLHVRDLILTDRHERGPIQQDVGRLQQRVAEKTVGREVLVSELGLLVLVRRYALEPAERRDHRQQQMQLRVFRHVGLHEQCGDAGIESRSEPVDHDAVHALRNAARVGIPGGQSVPVRDEEKALVLVLQFDPVAQRAVVVTQVQRTGRPHARQHAACLRICAHGITAGHPAGVPATMALAAQPETLHSIYAVSSCSKMLFL
jgi:hypothetical protein